MEEVNKYSICGKHELKWEVKKHYANIFSLTSIGIELLIEDIYINIKQRLTAYNRKIEEASKNRP
ncbi:hypothetical protein V7654_09790 [Bacillus sp. JJ1609]|uniref:hypothetical protein n=1 Tax=Bacillus sp. JJ1609 TaxID=3122977 RepID=UPI002FFF48A4